LSENLLCGWCCDFSFPSFQEYFGGETLLYSVLVKAKFELTLILLMDSFKAKEGRS